MGTFLKVFFGIILIVVGLIVIFGSLLFGGFAGLGSTLVGVVIGIAMLAGGMTLFIKIRG